MLRVEVHPSADEAAVAAAKRIESSINSAARANGVARVVFAAAPSQAATLAVLSRADVPWDKVEAFHMDEYVGLPIDDPARFGMWLRRNLFDAVRPGTVHLMDPGPSPATECERYSALLRTAP